MTVRTIIATSTLTSTESVTLEDIRLLHVTLRLARVIKSGVNVLSQGRPGKPDASSGPGITRSMRNFASGCRIASGFLLSQTIGASLAGPKSYRSAFAVRAVLRRAGVSVPAGTLSKDVANPCRVPAGTLTRFRAQIRQKIDAGPYSIRMNPAALIQNPNVTWTKSLESGRFIRLNQRNLLISNDNPNDHISSGRPQNARNTGISDPPPPCIQRPQPRLYSRDSAIFFSEISRGLQNSSRPLMNPSANLMKLKGFSYAYS